MMVREALVVETVAKTRESSMQMRTISFKIYAPYTKNIKMEGKNQKTNQKHCM